MATTCPALPTSRHFQLEQLAEGVYAAVLPDIMANISANSNAGIVDLGDTTLVFDTFMTPVAAADLCTAAEQLTGRPPSYVINSHYHYDHVRGNQVFPAQAAIISTTKTRELISTKGADHIRQDRSTSTLELQKIEEQMVAEGDPRQRDLLCITAAEGWAIQESLPILELRLPNWTFDSQLVLHGSHRTIQVITLGGGHTESDAFLVLPAERIAFLGDLLFVGHHPYLGHGDPHALNQTLAAIEQLDVETVVPGHGPVGTTADSRLLRQYLSTLEELTLPVIRAGGSAEEAAAQEVPPPFASWQFGFFLRMNLHFLYERLASHHPADSTCQER